MLKQKLIRRNCLDLLETQINHLIKNKRIRQSSTKGEQNWHDWVGKVIHWELCKRLEFDPPTKWYMHKPESVQENETHRILQDFEI